MNYLETYIGRIMNAFSRLGNTVIGGHHNVSISARIGYNVTHNNNLFWRICEQVVDRTFYPIDGKEHCKNAYIRWMHEPYFTGGSFVFMVILVCILQVVCLPLMIVFYLYFLIKKIFKR